MLALVDALENEDVKISVAAVFADGQKLELPQKVCGILKDIFSLVTSDYRS